MEKDLAPHLTKLIEWSKTQFLVRITWGEKDTHYCFVEISCAGEKHIVMRDTWGPLNEDYSKDEHIDLCAKTLLKHIENEKTLRMLKTALGQIDSFC